MAVPELKTSEAIVSGHFQIRINFAGAAIIADKYLHSAREGWAAAGTPVSACSATF